MNKGYQIIKKNQRNITKWSGGTMSELLIYPKNANFGDKNFIFEIASATVDLEKSNFTEFANHNRIIMTLDNKLELIHNNDEKVTLNKYEPHVFDGGADTVSYGQVTDFNLIMHKDKCCGDAVALSITKNSIIHPRKAIHSYDNNLEIIYCVNGSLTFKPNNENHIIHSGDLLIIDHKILGKDYYYTNDSYEICEIIISMIMCNN